MPFPIAPLRTLATTTSNLAKNRMNQLTEARDNYVQNQVVARNNARPYGTLPVAPNRTSNQQAQQAAAAKPSMPAPSAAPAQPSGADPGFTSSDANVQARIRQMQQQAEASATAQRQPTAPTGTPTQAPVSSMAPKIKLPEVGSYSVPESLAQARQAAIDALRPGSDENALADQLAGFRGSTQQGVLGLEGQGRGIPLGLVRGMQGKLLQQANVQEQTLMERLAAAQAQRQLAAQAAQTQLGFSQQDFEGQQALEAEKRKQMQSFMNPQEIGGNIIQFNPETGQYETVYSSPATAGEGFTLGKDQYRFDANGNLVAQGPEGSEVANQPASIQEYEYARQNGFTGSFLDYAQQKSGPSASTIPATVKQDLASAQTLIDLISQIPTEGGIPGVGATGRFPDWAISQQGQDARFTLNNILSELAKLRGGTSFTDSEKKLLDSYVPSPTDLDYAVKGKLRNLKSFLETKMGNIQSQFGSPQQQGQLTSPDQIDQFLDSFSNDLGMSQNGRIVDVTIGPKTVQVSDAIARNLQAADAELFRDTGQHLVINEALRSHERQGELYNLFKTGQGGRAAPPGQSFHETGKAVDVQNWQLAMPYLRKYGFKNDLADDRNHFSINEFS